MTSLPESRSLGLNSNFTLTDDDHQLATFISHSFQTKDHRILR